MPVPRGVSGTARYAGPHGSVPAPAVRFACGSRPVLGQRARREQQASREEGADGCESESFGCVRG